MWYDKSRDSPLYGTYNRTEDGSMRTGFPRLFLLVCAVSALLLSACGSSSNNSSSSATSSSAGTTTTTAKAATPTGPAIKIGQIAPVGGQVDYPDMRAAAEGAVRGINARGGIAGRP